MPIHKKICTAEKPFKPLPKRGSEEYKSKEKQLKFPESPQEMPKKSFLATKQPSKQNTHDDQEESFQASKSNKNGLMNSSVSNKNAFDTLPIKKKGNNQIDDTLYQVENFNFTKSRIIRFRIKTLYLVNYVAEPLSVIEFQSIKLLVKKQQKEI